MTGPWATSRPSGPVTEIPSPTGSACSDNRITTARGAVEPRAGGRCRRRRAAGVRRRFRRARPRARRRGERRRRRRFMRALRPGWARPAQHPHGVGDADHETCGEQRDQPGRDEGRLVVAEPGAGGAGAPGGDGGAELVGAEDPAEDDADVLASERLGRDRDRRRHGRDPVEPVEDDEGDQAEVRRADHEREDEQRQAAQAVVPEEQPARVVAIGEPARAEGADEVEDADHGEQAGGRHLGHAVIHRGRDQVRPDQPVRRRAADEEAPREQPERRGAGRRHEAADRGPERVLAQDHRVVLDGAVGAQPDLGGAVPQEERDERQRERERDDRHRQRGRAPALRGDDPAEQRQEHELAGRVARGEHSGHEPAPLHEPAARDHGREGDTDRAGREAVGDAPEQVELPRRVDLRRQGRADRDRRQRDHDHPADSEAVVEPGREGAAEAVEDEVDRDGGRDRRARPAELVLQRHDQHADRRAEAAAVISVRNETAAMTQP